MTSLNPFYSILGIGCGILLVLSCAAGAIVLFVRGRSRAFLAGAGFAVLGLGILIIRLLGFYSSGLAHEFNLDVETVQLLYAVPNLILIVGWILIIVAVVRVLRSAAAPSGTVPPPGQAPPGPGYGGPPPGYGAPPAGPPPGPPRY